MYNKGSKSATTYEPRQIVAALQGIQSYINVCNPYAQFTFGELLSVLSAFLVATAKAETVHLQAVTRGAEAIDTEQWRDFMARASKAKASGDAIAAIDAGVDEVPNFWSREQ
ncbi:hypothetical protein IJ103_00200 [Candidatus Saccharibacteria bacterium]|nr:hypothetical protein [Candidatus Saccharibacteria bacterium]